MKPKIIINCHLWVSSNETYYQPWLLKLNVLAQTWMKIHTKQGSVQVIKDCTTVQQ